MGPDIPGLAKATAVIGFLAGCAAWWNYSTWAVFHDDNSYYYARQKNGWWTLMWLAVLLCCVATCTDSSGKIKVPPALQGPQGHE